MRENKKRDEWKEQFRPGALSWIKEAVYKMHSLHPDYIFLTETSAVPFGYSMKEAWREAFPGEPIPKFYRIEPHSKINEYNQEGVRKYLEKRIKKDNAKVIVFDETSGSEEPVSIFKYNKDQKPDTNLIPPQIIFEDIFDPKGRDPTIEGVTATQAARFLDSASSIASKKIGELYCLRGCTNYIYYSMKTKDGRGHPTIRNNLNLPLPQWGTGSAYEKEYLRKHGEHILEKEQKGQFHGFIVKDSSQRKRALELIANLKELGKEAGEELRAEREAKKKGLEGKLGIISIAGFLFYIFSFSGITGNVIGTTETKSITGIISILIGLTTGGIYLYLKRKTKN